MITDQIVRAEEPDADRETAEGGALQSTLAETSRAVARNAWSEAELRASALIRETTGLAMAEHLTKELTARPAARMLAVGAGAGSAALDLARHVPETEIVCIDPGVDTLRPLRERAAEFELHAEFATADLGGVLLEPHSFDLVFCHAVLHRVMGLEALADQIELGLRPGGALVAVELAARNDYRMWPETRQIAHSLWATLPAKYRLNHTAHGTPLIDDEIWEPEPRNNRGLDSRSEDVLPVLNGRFSREHYVPYFSLCRRFFDTMYGPNYDLREPLDLAIFNWIWQLDIHYLAAERLRPETFFAVYRAG